MYMYISTGSRGRNEIPSYCFVQYTDICIERSLFLAFSNQFHKQMCDVLFKHILASNVVFFGLMCPHDKFQVSAIYTI